MFMAEIVGEIRSDPEPKYRDDGKQHTICTVSVPTRTGELQKVNVVCFTEKNGERLRRCHNGDTVQMRGHLSFLHHEGRPSSVGLNLRGIRIISKGNNHD